MSQFVGNALPQFTLQANETQAHLQAFQPMERSEGARAESFRSSWWPGTGLMGSLGSDVAIMDDNQHWFEPPEITRGHNSRLGIAGVTRDQYGSPIGSCIVKLFKTSTDELVSQIVSDPNTGAYLLSTPYFPDTHYVVAYKAGFPDVAGATINTLIGL